MVFCQFSYNFLSLSFEISRSTFLPSNTNQPSFNSINKLQGIVPFLTLKTKFTTPKHKRQIINMSIRQKVRKKLVNNVFILEAQDSSGHSAPLTFSPYSQYRLVRDTQNKKQMHLSKEKVKQLQITKFKRFMNNLCLRT